MRYRRLNAELLRLQWLADASEVQLDELTRAWEETVDGFTGLGHVFEIARSQARLAAVYRVSGRVDAATALAAEARDVARRLGAAPMEAEIDRLGLGASSRPARESSEAPTLTPRELDVLRLVAIGQSNGQIARQLFISTKTVSVHVSNILAKLQVSSRTEAAALAHREGLLDEQNSV